MAGEIPPLLQDLGVILAVAAVTTILFNRFKQPVVLGYLLAGFLVGPHTPPFSLVREVDTIRVLGEIGVVFLLFALGLEFNLRKLRRVGMTALVSGTLQVAIMIWLGYVLGRAFGLEPTGALFLGAIMSISSTVIIVKVVGEMRQQDAEWAQIVFGILIVEDILAVLLLTGLGAAGGAGTLDNGILGLLATFFAFVLLALLVGLLLVPRLMTFVARMGVDEVLVVTALALGVGLAVLGSFLGFSPALGAFVAGALVGESALHKTVEERVAPVRDLFSAIFFVTVGMLVDPAAMRDHWALIAAVTLAIIVGKIFAGSFATFVTGRDVTTSLRVGFGLAQIGEFSFILAALAATLAVTDAPLYVVAVSAAGITAFTTPVLMRRAPGVARLFERHAPRPLLTFTNMYGAWTQRLRDAAGPDPARRAATRDAVLAVVYAAATIATIALGAASAAGIQRTFRSQTGVAIAWLVVGMLALSFGALYVRAQRRFAESLADAALPAARRGPEGGAVVRKVLVRTFFFGGLVIASAFLLLFASPFIPTGILLALVLGGVLLSGTVLYRALSRVQDQLEGSLRDVLSSAKQSERQEILDLVREKYPWAVSVRDVRLPDGGRFAPVSLRRLHVRGRTGASVVAIERGGKLLLNPAPDAQLLPEDRVVLMGDEDQVAAAVALLENPPPPEPLAQPETAEVQIHAGSALAGRTLGELRLRDRAGVSVMAVLREGAPVAHPGSETRVEAGDTLVVLGLPGQLQRVRELAAPAER